MRFRPGPQSDPAIKIRRKCFLGLTAGGQAVRAGIARLQAGIALNNQGALTVHTPTLALILVSIFIVWFALPLSRRIGTPEERSGFDGGFGDFRSRNRPLLGIGKRRG